MADSVDRVFGHALNTVNRIRPGSQKPPPADRLALYGLYKQSMEGDVSLISDRPTSPGPGVTMETVRKEQEKWDAWKANEGLSRTEAKRRYIESLISTMHKYASTTPEARELVEELEFVWDQIKNNSQHSSSEHSSPLQTIERRDYINSRSSGDNGTGTGRSDAAAMDSGGRVKGLTLLAPQSEADEDELAEDERDEFVDAPVSQIDEADLHHASESGGEADSSDRFRAPRSSSSPLDNRWRKRIESSLIKLTTEVAALREQLETRRFLNYQRRHSWWGWVLRLSWWAVQLFIADGIILWIVILHMRRKDDRRLETAIRVLLGDAVAQAQSAVRDAKMPTLPSITRGRNKSPKR
ncbi:putative acyl-CoA-binding protein, ACBP [Septoria linicola]|nr:putative acyl-CoA-binding protein, ACBP [Septoria linicola]